MDYGHTVQPDFFTEGMGNADPNANPDLKDSLTDQEGSSYAQSSKMLGNVALDANNSMPEDAPISGLEPRMQDGGVRNNGYPTPPQLGQILPTPDSISPTPDTQGATSPTASQTSFLDEHGEASAAEINNAASNPSDLYETMLNSRITVNGGSE